MRKHKALIIVESPAKIKTLRKFLGPEFVFESSIGHVRDLPEREFGIDLEHDFEPTYVVMPTKEEVIAKLCKAAKDCDVVYLSPDPDREGEAIAWHIAQILPAKTKIKRISFHSITKEAVLQALEHPREIDIALVNAQQARRLLDRIVGYKISPLLNRRIQRGRDSSLSAGRVQSVALKLVVEREKEIDAFIPVEYWNLGAILHPEVDERNFRAALYSVDGKRVEKEPIEGKEVMLISTKEIADTILDRMREGTFRVLRVERKEKKRYAVPPFITSTLQQEASRHHGFSSSRTMSIAQSLYEGVNLGEQGFEGLITYMRTDSVRIAPEAIEEVRRYIEQQYGPQFIPATPKLYTTQKSAQDAHEAIRPTSMAYAPDIVKPYLNREQFLLYQLIWRRFVASQMIPAIYDTVSADISAGEGLILRATGSVIKFSGFLAVYEEKHDDDERDDEHRLLPPLEEGQLLVLHKLFGEQAFTRPPPRYNEASLVKELEKLGIGRPSTYAAIMNKIQSRDYTTKESGRLKPTELGRVIAQMLEANFQQIMNVGFTANMEDDLERVAENRKDWKALMREFWEQFSPTLETALKEAFVPRVATDIECPKCHEGKLQKIWSHSKYFYGCTRYPECDYSAPTEEISFDRNDYADDFDWDQACPICGSSMKLRHGRYGPFLGCTRYPECRGIVNIPKKGEILAKNLPPCPAIGCPGQIMARKSRFGKTFYSCSTFPECDVIVNQLDQLALKYADHPRTPSERKAKAKPAKKAATKKTAKTKTAKTVKATKVKATKLKAPRKSNTPKVSLGVSPELAALIGQDQIESRPALTKKVWDYIKAHALQDKTNKRLIVSDAVLAKVLGTQEPVDMFALTGLIGKHVRGAEKKETGA